ncbi:hypothetical protein POTOM_061071 [Populus tomentosa]|uniref:Uncharacterized protein n=1 Tax=Populus tomentosa TaxID=118781 RepID=A0A8X7XR72_POPTO|nr:hypothetical protein POTOM_061071 [Populus tomentosa]
MQGIPETMGELFYFEATQVSLNRAGHYFLEPEEFEAAWEEMTQLHGIRDHRWIQALHEDRKRYDHLFKCYVQAVEEGRKSQDCYEAIDVLTIGLAYPDSPSSTSLIPDSKAVTLLPKTLISSATTNVMLTTSAGLGRCQDIMADGNPEDLTGAGSSKATTVVTPPSTRMALGGFKGALLMTTTLTSSLPPGIFLSIIDDDQPKIFMLLVAKGPDLKYVLSSSNLDSCSL